MCPDPVDHRPATARSRDDLPAPESPTIRRCCPGCISRSKSRSSSREPSGVKSRRPSTRSGVPLSSVLVISPTSRTPPTTTSFPLAVSAPACVSDPACTASPPACAGGVSAKVKKLGFGLGASWKGASSERGTSSLTARSSTTLRGVGSAGEIPVTEIASLNASSQEVSSQVVRKAVVFLPLSCWTRRSWRSAEIFIASTKSPRRPMPAPKDAMFSNWLMMMERSLRMWLNAP
mmetsp:Transcript_12117/g.29391  ORF Transcript_12117/g.29391 Transcript_12117/m.29391 type:complete len:233 (+) Transcript_12117:629-1327(+)